MLPLPGAKYCTENISYSNGGTNAETLNCAKKCIQAQTVLTIRTLKVALFFCCCKPLIPRHHTNLFYVIRLVWF